MDFPFNDRHVGGRQWGMGLGLPIVLNLCFSEVLNRVDPTGPTPKCGRPKFGQSNPLEHSYPSRQIFNYIITKIPPLPPPPSFLSILSFNSSNIHIHLPQNCIYFSIISSLGNFVDDDDLVRFRLERL